MKYRRFSSVLSPVLSSLLLSPLPSPSDSLSRFAHGPTIRQYIAAYSIIPQLLHNVKSRLREQRVSFSSARGSFLLFFFFFAFFLCSPSWLCSHAYVFSRCIVSLHLWEMLYRRSEPTAGNSSLLSLVSCVWRVAIPRQGSPLS